MKRISIVIVTYNSEKDIYDCVDSIKVHADIPLEDIELIVVDNNSNATETMFENLRISWGQSVVCIKNTHNGGYGQGNNIGIRHSTAPITMIMNPDVRLFQPVFKEVLASFDKDKDKAIIGLTQRMRNGRIGRSTSWVTRIHPYIAEPLRFLTGKLNIYIYKYMYVCGACFFLRKDTFTKAGMFDENIFMYGEENDIHTRLMKLPNTRMGYLRHLSYYHMHEEVTDFVKADYKWMEKYMDTLLYTAERDSIPRKRVIAWEIKRNKISVLKERIKYILTGGRNADRLHYYEGWTERLKSRL